MSTSAERKAAGQTLAQDFGTAQDEHQVEHAQGHKSAMLPAGRPLPDANRNSATYTPVVEPDRE
jgi:hypothetical protein